MSKGIIEELKSLLNPESYLDVLTKLDTAALQALKQFGQGQAMAQKMRETLADSTKGVIELGGDLSNVLKTQTDVSSSIGRNVLVTAEASKDLYASILVTGQSVKQIVDGMADIGISALDATEQMKKIVDVARESGVNAQSVSSMVLKNTEAINKYNFDGGVTGLAKMAAQATMLRIDMQSTLNLAERVFKPEGAIEMAAAMQRLGVAQSDLLDPLRLMNLAQNDPTELQNQIAQMSKQFVQLGKDGNFEIMPGAKLQLREIEEAMKLPQGQLAKMALGSAELDRKLKEIKFPDYFSQEQKNLVANMAQMKDGKYVVTVEDLASGKMIEKTINSLSEQETKKLEEVANTAPKSMEDLAKEQVGFLNLISQNIAALVASPKLGIAASKPVGTGVSMVRDANTAITKATPEGFSPQGIREGINELVGGTKTLNDFVDYTTKEFKKSFETARTEIDALVSKYPILGKIAEIASGVQNTIQGKDVLKLPGQTIQLLPEDTFAAFTKGDQVLSNMLKNNNTQPQSNNSTVEINHKLDININSSGMVSPEQIKETLRDTGLVQALSVATKEAFYNNGLTTPTSNKQKLLVPTALQNS